jgi:hypothetical protein
MIFRENENYFVVDSIWSIFNNYNVGLRKAFIQPTQNCDRTTGEHEVI